MREPFILPWHSAFQLAPASTEQEAAAAVAAPLRPPPRAWSQAEFAWDPHTLVRHAPGAAQRSRALTCSACAQLAALITPPADAPAHASAPPLLAPQLAARVLDASQLLPPRGAVRRRPTPLPLAPLTSARSPPLVPPAPAPCADARPRAAAAAVAYLQRPGV